MRLRRQLPSLQPALQLVPDSPCLRPGCDAHRPAETGSQLAKLAIEEMVRGGCEEVVLEAMVSNTAALRLYQALGFIRDKRLQRYYLNGSDAYRLKLLLPPAPGLEQGVGTEPGSQQPPADL